MHQERRMLHLKRNVTSPDRILTELLDFQLFYFFLISGSTTSWSESTDSTARLSFSYDKSRGSLTTAASIPNWANFSSWKIFSWFGTGIFITCWSTTTLLRSMCTTRWSSTRQIIWKSTWINLMQPRGWPLYGSNLASPFWEDSDLILVSHMI